MSIIDILKGKSKEMGTDELNAMGAGNPDDAEEEAKLYDKKERQ